jgi:hypothetical protein
MVSRSGNFTPRETVKLRVFLASTLDGDGCFHAPAALPLEELYPFPTEYEARMTMEPV